MKNEEALAFGKKCLKQWEGLVPEGFDPVQFHIKAVEALELVEKYRKLIEAAYDNGPDYIDDVACRHCTDRVCEQSYENCSMSKDEALKLFIEYGLE